VIVNPLAGCERQPPHPPESPRETLRRLIAAREEQSYQKVKVLVVAERADEVLAVLMAVDDFLVANRELCTYVRDEVGLGLAQMIDQSALANHLEVFSPYVELLDEVVEGDAATVSFCIDGKLPVKQARLQRVGASWRYDPGPGYAPELPKAFHRMADGLREAIVEIKSGRLAVAALRDDPELLAKEVQLRLLPGVKMLPRPVEREDQGN